MINTQSTAVILHKFDCFYTSHSLPERRLFLLGNPFTTRTEEKGCHNVEAVGQAAGATCKLIKWPLSIQSRHHMASHGIHARVSKQTIVGTSRGTNPN